MNDRAAGGAPSLVPELFDRFRRGEPEARATVFDHFRPEVFAFLSRFEADTERLGWMVEEVLREVGESAAPGDGEDEMHGLVLRAMGSRLGGRTVQPG